MSQNNSSCPDTAWYSNAGETASFIIYSIFSPFYVLMGLFGHCLCLKAFYIKSKQESAYMYQIFTTVSETLEVISWFLYIFAFEMLGRYRKGIFIWYRSCYTCMQFAAIMGPFLLNAFSVMSQYFTVCMSADRLYALCTPTSYPLANSKRNYILAACFCVTVAVSISLHICFLYTVSVEKNGTNVDPPLYQLVYDPPNPAIRQAFSLLYSSTIVFGLVLLCFCNVALLYFYRVRVVKAGKALNLTNEQQKREEGEKTLLLLTGCQCIWMTLKVTSQISLLVVIVFFPVVYICTQPLFDPLFQGFLQFVDLCDLGSIILISKQFRLMIRQQMRCCGGSNVVEPTPMGYGHRSAPNVVRH